jgi:hypothetical protein
LRQFLPLAPLTAVQPTCLRPPVSVSARCSLVRALSEGHRLPRPK